MARSDKAEPTAEELARILSLGFVEAGVPGWDELRRWANLDHRIGILFHPFNPLPWGVYWQDDDTARFFTSFAAQLDCVLAIAAMAAQQ